MYHEEKIVNGKVYTRSTPDGEWRECSIEQVVAMLQRTRQELQKAEELAALQLMLAVFMPCPKCGSIDTWYHSSTSASKCVECGHRWARA